MAEIRVSAVTADREIDKDVWVALLSVLAVAVAVAGAAQVPIPVTSDYGLVAVLPPLFWAGLAALNILFGVAIRAPRPRPAVLLLLQACLVAVVYGTPGIASGTPRTEVAWRHQGIVRALLESGGIDSQIDAYFNWPGFFAGVASYVGVAHVDLQALALVAPVLNGLLWSGGVAAVARALTRDSHHVWLAVWLFTLTNWIDQDYLAPQAFAYFTYLVVLALLLGRLSSTPAVTLRQALVMRGPVGAIGGWWASRSPDEPDARRRVAALWVVLLLSAATIASHQLTPFMLLAGVVALTLTGRSWAPGLPAILGLMLALWLTTAASGYLHGHPVLFTENLSESTGANVSARIQGSVGHIRVTQVRTGLTVATFVLAGLGGLRMLASGRRDLRPALLMTMPFGMVPLQSYGGEMMMRATLFALPFACYFGAALFLPRARYARYGDGVRAAPLVVCLSLVLSAALITARYGNAAFDVFTRSDISGSRAMYRLAPPGALLIAAAHPTPWRFMDYTTFRQGTLTDMCPQPLRPRTCYPVVRDRAHHEEAGALLMLTRSSQESVRMQEDPSGQALHRLEAEIVRRGEAQLVYVNPDVRIYQFPPYREERSRG